jgi:parvulin-like peptidyl-prolyl isomerase
MRKRAILAMLMIAVVVLATSCNLIVKDKTVDAQTVIIEVAGKSITKAEVQDATQNTLAYQQYLYSMYGMDFDPTDAATIAAAQESAVEALIQAAVVSKKVTDGGFDAFTDEELATAQANADQTYQSNTDSVKSGYFTDTQLTGEELDKAVEAKMTELGYPTKDTVLSNEKLSMAQDKLRDSVIAGVSVTDEDIQQAFDDKVAAAMASYESSLSQYGSDVSGGTTVYYRPAGYRMVKNILRKFSDEDSSAISAWQSQVTDKQSDLDTNAASIAALPADAATDTAEQAQSRADLTAAKATLEAELAELNTQLTAAKDKAYAALQPTVDEIVAKLNAGDDFDALMAEYGEDTGMQSEPAMTEGYTVCAGSTQWVAEFTEAAMTLVNVGDVSAPFQTSYGIHIVKYVSNVAEGAVPLDSVKATLSDELLSQKQDELYNATIEQWITEANAIKYVSRLAD